MLWKILFIILKLMVKPINPKMWQHEVLENLDGAWFPSAYRWGFFLEPRPHELVDPSRTLTRPVTGEERRPREFR